MEVTAYGQMENIFKYGCYIIGTKETIVCKNYNEVISLSLEAKSKCHIKKEYILEELRDLESKLVLITGSKAENRAQVDHFVNVSLSN